MVYSMEFGGESRYYDMDICDLFKITISRVQKVEPEIAVNLIGCICLKGPAEMVQLAFGSDNFLLSKITDAKNMLGILSPNNSISDIQIGSYPPSGSHTTSCQQNNFPTPTHYWDPRLQLEQHPPSNNYDLVPRPYADFVSSSLHNQPQPAEQQENTNRMKNYYYQDAGSASRFNKRSHILSDLPPKTCHYFNKGFCKHGTNCRFSHAQSFTDGYSYVFSPNMIEYANEEHPFTPKALDKLEVDIVELLRSKRGMPVSIASLPMLYSERYGKSLQADGYLTESQRHGKAGYNLTKLLSHLRKSIRLIERPHGQHSVILAEDAPRYMEGRNERNDVPSNVSSSHQIYLTFPADSTFTEDDVSNYFRQYGQVRDVRLPSLERRMYGFVSFAHSETVNMILEQRNPHYICGARVLVKPYKEKSKNFDRSYTENSRSMSPYHSRNPNMDPDAHSVPQGSVERARQFKTHFIEREMERERMRLSRLNLVPAAQSTQQNYLNQGMEGPGNLLSHLIYEFDFLNDASDDKVREIRTSYSDQESGHIELPDSPFAGSSIPAGL